MDEKEDESRISNESDNIIHKKHIKMSGKGKEKIDAKNDISNNASNEKNHVESSYRSKSGARKKSNHEVVEAKSSISPRHIAGTPISRHRKNKLKNIVTKNKKNRHTSKTSNQTISDYQKKSNKKDDAVTKNHRKRKSQNENSGKTAF